MKSQGKQRCFELFFAGGRATFCLTHAERSCLEWGVPQSQLIARGTPLHKPKGGCSRQAGGGLGRHRCRPQLPILEPKEGLFLKHGPDSLLNRTPYQSTGGIGECPERTRLIWEIGGGAAGGTKFEPAPTLAAYSQHILHSSGSPALAPHGSACPCPGSGFPFAHKNPGFKSPNQFKLPIKGCLTLECQLEQDLGDVDAGCQPHGHALPFPAADSTACMRPYIATRCNPAHFAKHSIIGSCFANMSKLRHQIFRQLS